VKNAQDAGATVPATLFATITPISMGGLDPTITIMSLSITLADGNAIKAQLAGGVNATLRITTLADTVSGSTSRGSRRVDAGAKPDISAPGTTIISTGMGTGNQPATMSGTSMATPHIAGSMALLRQLHPDWSVAELKALIMNTCKRVRVAGNQSRHHSGHQSGK